MMSPDPPREDRPSSESDPLPPPDPGFIAVWDNEDDIFGDADGPYELDIGGSGDESDFSESGDEQGQSHRHYHSQPSEADPHLQNVNEGSTSSARTEGSTTRGHYQLLIPFPQPTTTSEQETEGDGENVDVDDNHGDSSNNTNSSYDHPQSNSLPQPQPTHSTFDNDNNDKMGTDSEGNSSMDKIQRDIDLTEENVQVIKSVMLNFSLPSASIPPWASELSDDVLKNRLSACLDVKQNDKKVGDGN